MLDRELPYYYAEEMNIDITKCELVDYMRITSDYESAIYDGIYKICCLKDVATVDEMNKMKDDLLNHLKRIYEPKLINGSKKMR